MTKQSDEVCERIIQTGLHAEMLNHLKWDTLSAKSLQDQRSSYKECFVLGHLRVLYHVVRRAETARAAFRECEAVNVVNEFRNVIEEPVICLLASISSCLLVPFQIMLSQNVWN